MPMPTNSLDANYFEFEPSDDVPLRVACDAIFVGTQGSLVVRNPQGETVTFANIADGTLIHIPGVTWVLAATSATDLVAMASKALR